MAGEGGVGEGEVFFSFFFVLRALGALLGSLVFVFAVVFWYVVSCVFFWVCVVSSCLVSSGGVFKLCWGCVELCCLRLA